MLIYINYIYYIFVNLSYFIFQFNFIGIVSSLILLYLVIEIKLI
jgi:hypothetical protein